MASVLYLLWVLRAGRLTAGRLAAATGFYLAFAVGPGRHALSRGPGLGRVLRGRPGVGGVGFLMCCRPPIGG